MVAGLNIFLYKNEGSHKEPHFHVTGAGVEVSINIRNSEIIRGKLPNNKRREILAFASRRRADLLEAQESLNAGLRPEWIEG
jgi:hypothetical protein